VCRIFYFHLFKGFCFAVCFFPPLILPFFSRGHTLHVFHLCFVPVLFSFVIFVLSCVCVCLLVLLCCLSVLCSIKHSLHYLVLSTLRTKLYIRFCQINCDLITRSIRFLLTLRLAIFSGVYGICLKNTTFRKLDLCPSSGKGKETPILLGPS
jgi:hypothetical protein